MNTNTESKTPLKYPICNCDEFYATSEHHQDCPVLHEFQALETKLKEAQSANVEAFAENLKLNARIAELEKEQDKLHVHCIEMINDWKKGDFDLCKLAQCDLQSIEEVVKEQRHAAMGKANG